LERENRFHKKDFMIPCIPADDMGFGFLPAIHKKSTFFNVSTTSGVIKTMKEFEPSDEVIQRLEELTERRDNFLYAFTDIIPLTAPFMRRKNSQIVRVPAPMERPNWIFFSNTGRAAFRHILQNDILERFREYENSPGHNRSLNGLVDKYGILNGNSVPWRIANQSDRDAAKENGQRSCSLNQVHNLWDKTEEYFDRKAREMKGAKEELYSALVRVHLKNAVLADKYAERVIDNAENRYSYNNLEKDIPKWNERMAETLGQYTHRFDAMKSDMCDSGYNCDVISFLEMWVNMMIRGFCWQYCHTMVEQPTLPSEYWRSSMPVFIG
jgi:hypothetical protein